MDLYISVYAYVFLQTIYTGHYSPTNWIVEDPIVVCVNCGSTNPTQDTVIPFSAVLDRVDVNVVSLNAISVTV